MVNLGAPTFTVSTADQPVTGYFNGGKAKGEASLVASKIVSPNVIGGVTGKAIIETLCGKKVATGQITSDASHDLTVTGLSFQPYVVIAHNNSKPSYQYANIATVANAEGEIYNH